MDRHKEMAISIFESLSDTKIPTAMSCPVDDNDLAEKIATELRKLFLTRRLKHNISVKDNVIMVIIK